MTNTSPAIVPTSNGRGLTVACTHALIDPKRTRFAADASPVMGGQGAPPPRDAAALH